MVKAILFFTLISSFLAGASWGQSLETRLATDPRTEPRGEYLSPDGTLIARVQPVGKSGREWAESRVEIRRRNGERLRGESFASVDHEHGEGVSYGAWTPDSMHFVFTTTSSGGHQPWRGPAYFYSRRRNLIAKLDDYIRVSPSQIFSVSAPDVVQINTYIPAPPGHPMEQTRVTSVRLGRLRIAS
jgi:hypothetical protein